MTDSPTDATQSEQHGPSARDGHARAPSGVAVVKRLHDAYNRRDRDGLLECIDDGVIWHVEGDEQSARTYVGRDRVWREVFAPMWASPARIRDDLVRQHGEYVVAFQHALHDFGAGPSSWVALEVLRVGYGRVAERWQFTTDRGSLDRALQQGCVANLEVA